MLVSAVENDNRDIWLYDIERGTGTRITFSPEDEFFAGWFHRGRDILFSRGSIAAKTFLRPADGSGDPQPFVDGYHTSVVDDAEFIAYTVFNTRTGQDIYYRQLDSDAEPQPFLQTEANEGGAALSPDGKHIVYWSNESGANHIYMKSFPTGAGKWQVSTSAGVWPRWSRAGDEIIFRAGSGATASLMSVSVRTSPSVQLGTPQVIFAATDSPKFSFRSGSATYDVTSDPDVFVMVEETDQRGGAVTRLVFAEDWYASYPGARE